MESRYGIGINNRYALFLDEDGEGDEDMQRSAPVTNSNNKGDKTTEPSTKKGVNQSSTNPTKANNNKDANNFKEDKENRSGDRFQGKRVLDARKAQDGPRETREDRNNRRNRQPDDKNEQRTDQYRGGRGGRGGGSERGGGGRGGPRGGRTRREFERKSGDDRTGVKAVDKREGGGSRNWGTFEDDIKAEDDRANVSASDETSNVNGDSKENNNNETEEDEQPKIEEPKTFTLGEWKAQQKEKRDVPKYNTRKAGEGSEIDPKWKKTYAYKKEKETHDEEYDDEEQEYYPQRVNRQKRVLDIQFSFTDNSVQRGGRGEGGRGGPRGGGGRGRGGGGGGGGRERNGEERRDERREERRENGERGERRPERRGGGAPRGGSGRGGRGGGPHVAPNVMDEKSFPTLGMKK